MGIEVLSNNSISEFGGGAVAESEGGWEAVERGKRR